MSKKLLLLSAEQENWAPKELVKAAEKAGFEVEAIDPELCYISLTGEPYISFEGTQFKAADICIPRLSEEHLDYKVAIMNHVEKMGIKILNTGTSMRTASSKIDTQIKLNKIGLKTPKTALFISDEQLEFAIESIGGKYPVIIKTLYGTQGVGVIRADSAPSLKSIAQQMTKAKVEFMLQEYIEHDESARILLLGDKVLAAVMRGTPKGDFRTNAHQGAELTVFEPSEEEIEAVKKAAEAIGITFSAVDYIKHEDEILILEINGSPGFEAMQKVVDVNIAEAVIKFCEDMLNEKDEDKKDDKEDVDKDFSLEDPIEVKVKGDHNQVEIEVAKPETNPTEPSGPTEEEEEEEEVKDHKKVVDVEKEKAEDKGEEPEDNKDKEVDMHPHQNVVSPEMLDKSHEHIIGTVTSVKIAHFNDDVEIPARVDTGANTSSIAGEDIKIDKDTNKVSFKFNNVTYRFNLLRTAKIKQADSDKVTLRPVIRVDLDINGITLKNIELNVNKRSDMNYAILLGRSTLAQAGFLVNPAATLIVPQKAVVSIQGEEE